MQVFSFLLVDRHPRRLPTKTNRLLGLRTGFDPATLSLSLSLFLPPFLLSFYVLFFPLRPLFLFSPFPFLPSFLFVLPVFFLSALDRAPTKCTRDARELNRTRLRELVKSEPRETERRTVCSASRTRGRALFLEKHIGKFGFLVLGSPVSILLREDDRMCASQGSRTLRTDGIFSVTFVRRFVVYFDALRLAYFSARVVDFTKH